MYADRYQPRRVNRGSLALSVGVVAPVLALAMLSSPTIREHFTKPPIDIYNVPPPPPPPKPDPLPVQPHTRALPTPPVPVPIPRVPTIPTDPLTFPTDPLPPLDPGIGGNETGLGSASVDPVKPAPPVLTGAEVDGRYARDLQPGYPPTEQRAGRDGLVTLKVLVGIDGRVREVEQLAATSDAFWEATRKQALGRWRFRPATRDGIPVEAWKTMTVRFRLEDAGL